jgi:hypothetical protein
LNKLPKKLVDWLCELVSADAIWLFGLGLNRPLNNPREEPSPDEAVTEAGSDRG